MAGQRILGRKSITRHDVCAGLCAALLPILLTGCLFEAEDAGDRRGETTAPLVQTADQVMRVHKRGRLALRPAKALPAPASRPTIQARPARPPRVEEARPPQVSAGAPPLEPEGRGNGRVETLPAARTAPSLARFHRALHQLKTGARHAPVTILHLGDSHIASDRFTGDVREMLRARFGDAGRGLMMPGFPFAYYRARGVKFARRGTWKAANSFRGAKGPFGITGVRLTSSQKGARLSLASDGGPFEWAEVTFLTGPRHGSAFVAVNNKGRMVSTKGESGRVKRVRIDHKGVELSIRVQGDGPVSLLSWAVGNNRPGIRYVNLGIPGATADTARRWDNELVAEDIRHLKPDLIVLGFGTNEGFNDGLRIADYEQRVADLADRLMAAAPQAALAIIGPPDAARYPRYATGRSAAGCRPLSAGERSDYARLYRSRSKTLMRWHAPPKLAEVRAALARVAKARNAHYWDWSAAMGGPCAVHEWSRSRPRLAASDHVHITARGSLLSAHAFYASLIAGYDAAHKVASSTAPGRQESEVR